MVATNKYKAEKRIDETPALLQYRELLLCNQEAGYDNYWIAYPNTSDDDLIKYAQAKKERLDRVALDHMEGKSSKYSACAPWNIPKSRGIKGSRGGQRE